MLRSALAFCLVGLVAPCSAAGQTAVQAVPVLSFRNWSDPAMWSSAPLVPDNTATHVFDVDLSGPAPLFVTVDQDVALRSLRVGDASLHGSGSRIVATGELQITDGLAFSGSGALVSQGALDLSGRLGTTQWTLRNEGSAVVSGAGLPIVVTDFENATGSSLDIQRDLKGVLRNEGSIRLRAGTRLTSGDLLNDGELWIEGELEAWNLRGSGAVHLATGATADLGGLLEAGSRIDGAGQVQLGGTATEVYGAYDVSGSSAFASMTVFHSRPDDLGSSVFVGGTARFLAGVPDVAELTGGPFAGELEVVGDMTVLGAAAWSSGALSGPGATTVGGDLSLSGGRLVGRSLVSRGHGTAEGSFTLVDGTLRNEGEFEVDSGWSVNGTGRVENAGLWRVTGGQTVQTSFWNDGHVDVSGSGLALVGGGGGSGTFHVGDGALLRVADFAFAERSAIGGTGSLRLEGLVEVPGVEFAGFTDVRGEATFGSADSRLGQVEVRGRLVVDGVGVTVDDLDYGSRTLPGPGLSIHEGRFETLGVYRNESTTVVLDEGVLASTAGLSIAGGRIEGTGALEGDVEVGGPFPMAGPIFGCGLLAPCAVLGPGNGPAAGRIGVTGDLLLDETAALEIHIGPGPVGDVLEVTGRAELRGLLEVSFLGTPELDETDEIPIVLAGRIDGFFWNAPKRERVLSSDGLVSFEVLYQGGQAVLTGFRRVPEAPTALLVLPVLAGAALRRRPARA